MNQWPIQKRLPLPTEKTQQGEGSNKMLKLSNKNSPRTEGGSWFCSCYHWDFHHTLTISDLAGTAGTFVVVSTHLRRCGVMMVIVAFRLVGFPNFFFWAGFHCCANGFCNKSHVRISEILAALFAIHARYFVVFSIAKKAFRKVVVVFSPPDPEIFFGAWQGIDLFLLQVFTKVAPWILTIFWEEGDLLKWILPKSWDRRCFFSPLLASTNKKQNEVRQSFSVTIFLLSSGFLVCN